MSYYQEIFDNNLKTLEKVNRIKRIYEDDDFIIDLFPADQSVRVSIFKDGHYQDEVLIRKDDYCG